MSKVIPINKDPIKNLSDTKFAEIEKDLMNFFMMLSIAITETLQFFKQKNMQKNIITELNPQLSWGLAL